MPHTVIARWYLIQTKPRQESRAEEHLRRQHYECFRPLRRLPGSRGEKTESLFPGYLFIHLDCIQQNWYPIRSTRGVKRIVSFGSEPTPVQDSLIEDLRLRSDLAQQALAFNPGEPVRYRQNEHCCLDAIFLAADGEERSLILLKLLQREHTLSVRTHALRPLCLH